MAKKISGEEALGVFSQYGLIDYLSQNFEVLHTQSPQWLLEEVEEFINLRKAGER